MKKAYTIAFCIALVIGALVAFADQPGVTWTESKEAALINAANGGDFLPKLLGVINTQLGIGKAQLFVYALETAVMGLPEDLTDMQCLEERKKRRNSQVKEKGVNHPDSIAAQEEVDFYNGLEGE